MRKTYGYVRVSSQDQNEARQYLELLDMGIDKKYIYMDKLSGKDFNRPAYHKLVYKKLKQGGSACRKKYRSSWQKLQ